MSSEFEITDRYKAAGIPYPDPKTICEGQCEGMGCYPQFLDGPWLASDALRLKRIEIPVVDDLEELPSVLDNPTKVAELDTVSMTFQCPDPTDEEVRRWHEAHNALDAHKGDGGKCDGWHFIKCPDCNGTGKRLAHQQEGEPQ